MIIRKQVAMPPELSHALVRLHADMHPERSAIQELLAAGVAPATLLNLYPLDMQASYHWLATHFAQWHVPPRFIRTLNDNFTLLDPELDVHARQQKWLSLLSAAHGNELHALYGPAGDTSAAREALSALLLVGNVTDERVRARAHLRLKSIHCRLLMAARWAQLPELHGLERDFARELAGVRYALCL